MLYQDRREAGQKLAKALKSYRGTDAVAYALPRGGVVLGAEIKTALGIPLDLVIARKVGHPYNPEYAICAVTESGQPVCNEEERVQVDAEWLEQATARERAEAARRRERYLGGRSSIPATGRTAILVDDGIATGLTMLAAIREIRAQEPREIVVAIPVVPRDTVQRLEAEGARVTALEIPDLFLGAVGMYYADFHPVSDEEVIELLQRDPVLFTSPEFAPMAAQLLNLPQLRAGDWSAARFPNGELRITLASSVRGEDAFVLGALTPPDERMLTLLLLCDTLRKEGATTVTLLAPYLAYMRQEKDEEGKSKATHWVGALLQASGVMEVVTVDIHSGRAEDSIPLPVVSLSPAAIFAAEIERIGWQGATVVAPDQGAVARCEDVRREARIAEPVAYMQKERTPDGVRGTLHGEAGRRAVVIDDILDTGGTLVACCEALWRSGTEDIVIMVTHGLFTGEAWQHLWGLGVSCIYCTDTVPLGVRDERIRVLSVAPMLERFCAG
jgi:ribose-phosphate pyrophosphokinase